MPHYVLHEIESGELIKTSEEPFTSADMKLGLAVEFFKTALPNTKEYMWNPKNLMWRRR
jgi:hypothetical protein